MLPEVLRLVLANDVGRINPRLLRPDIVGLVVLLIDCHVDPCGIQTDDLCAELPSPGDGLILKIIAKGEVPQHLKKSAVAGRVTYVFNIRRADALLACCHAAARRLHLTGKILFHRRHTGIDEQQALIPVWDQRKARQPQMSLALIKAEIFFTQFIQAHRLHIFHS